MRQSPKPHRLGIPLLALVALSTVVGLVGGARVAEARLTQAEVARLEKGEVVAHYWKLKGGSVGTGKAVGLVDATPEQVFSVIVDVARYKDYMNRVVESRITRREGKHYDFYYKIDMPWPLSDYWFVTRNTHYSDLKRRVYKRSWTLRRGSFARNDGYWHVRPWRGKTMVTYSTVLQPKSAMPQFVLNYVTKKSLPKSIANIRKRVAWLKRHGKLK